eukprot:3012725-Rhodomonas_salina.1
MSAHLDDRLSGLHLPLALGLERHHFLGDLGALLFLDGRDRLLLLRDRRLLPDDHEQLVRRLLLLLHQRHVLDQVLLELSHLSQQPIVRPRQLIANIYREIVKSKRSEKEGGYLLRGGVHLLESVLEAVFEHVDLLLLVVEHRLVEVDEVEERLGRGVVVAALARQKLLRLLVHVEVHVGHVRRHVLSILGLDPVHALDEAVGDRDERVLRPRVAVVEGRAVDERGELARADAELVADRREAQAQVQ